MEAATSQHATANTVFHCLYGYYNRGIPKSKLAEIYGKTVRTITHWIQQYEETGTFERAKSKTDGNFKDMHRKWLVDFYATQPLAYLDEAQKAFKDAHEISISKSSVWRIIHDYGLTWKVLERHTVHIKDCDVNRFIKELSIIDWSHHSLCFLDEVSFDNREMLRKREYALRGQTLAIG